MHRLAIFGSTGSVGRQALEVVRAHRAQLSVSVLAAGSSVALLAQQAREFDPAAVLIGESEHRQQLVEALGPGFGGDVLSGTEALAIAASRDDVDCVLAAMVGVRGLPVTVAAVSAGKRLALANKESLVAAGPLVMREARRTGAEIIPVDSEHSALFQALASGEVGEVRKLILTGSGGPFRTRPRETWDDITVEEALNHPTWSMGRKITIDSATMMNKALEIVEARHLFDVPAEKLAVVVHPQSIVHSMVEFQDGSVVAQMGPPDMRCPIQYALTWPRRLEGVIEPFQPAAFSGLTFEEPDLDRFPSLRLGFQVAERGGLSGAVLNAANERAVELFLAGEIPFPALFSLVEEVLSRFPDREIEDLQGVLDADCWAREEVLQCL